MTTNLFERLWNVIIDEWYNKRRKNKVQRNRNMSKNIIDEWSVIEEQYLECNPEFDKISFFLSYITERLIEVTILC